MMIQFSFRIQQTAKMKPLLTRLKWMQLASIPCRLVQTLLCAILWHKVEFYFMSLCLIFDYNKLEHTSSFCSQNNQYSSTSSVLLPVKQHLRRSPICQGKSKNKHSKLQMACKPVMVNAIQQLLGPSRNSKALQLQANTCGVLPR